jgi:hypothetical protein
MAYLQNKSLSSMLAQLGMTRKSLTPKNLNKIKAETDRVPSEFQSRFPHETSTQFLQTS